MSSKPEPTLNPFQILSSGGAMQLSGRDARAFAQAQFANDIAPLGDGQWHWNLWLSPKGRVIAIFILLRLDAQNLLLWSPDFPVSELAQRLLRFRFRSKLEIIPLGDCASRGAFVAPARLDSPALGNRCHIEGAATDWTHLDFDLGAASGRCLRLRCAQPADATPDPDFAARWLLEDMAHGLPRLGPEQVEAHTPQMLGLERLAAFSVKKGCYPGQEIVARTHFLGQAKRSLLRFALDAPARAGTRLESDTGARAELVSTASLGARHEALAVGPAASTEAFRSADGGLRASPLPLLDGLARGRAGG